MNLFDSPAPQSSRSLVPEAAAACLRRGGAVVTGNRRAARALRAAHAAQQRRLGLEAWSSPAILDWDEWTASLWHEYLLHRPDAPLLLTPLQERSVWKWIAEKHGEAQQVVSVDGLAQQAKEAYALLSAYDCKKERDQSWAHADFGDAETFRRWSLTFDKECRANGWLSRSDLETLLVGGLKLKALTPPVELWLTGFDRFTPMQDLLLDDLKGRGTVVHEAEFPAAGQTAPRVIEARDLRDEITACAWWLRRRLEQSRQQRIGVLVQDVSSLRGEIGRIFRSVLTPASAGIDARTTGEPFEFSLGSPLVSVAPVKAALLFLRWLVAPLEEEEVSWLLLSDFVFEELSGADLGARAKLDAELRQRGGLQPEIDIDTWLRKLDRARSAAAPVIRTRLKALLEAARASGIQHRSRSFADWVEFAQGLLSRAGWWPAASQDSLQFQALRRWERLLDEAASLAFDGSRVSYDEFVTVLERHAAEMIFAPESHDAPVQIMGPLESAGQQFDAVWFLGVDDTQWPQPARPHSLIPLWLQRKAEMPHATTRIDWDLSRDVTRRIAASAPDCVFSYSAQNVEGALRPSPLLLEVGSVPSETTAVLLAELATPLRERVSRAVEEEDASAVPWPIDLPAGGTGILKKQAACPFQSFASRRLAAEDLNRAEWGLTAMERGSIVHKVMEGVWSLKTEPEWRLLTLTDLVTAVDTFRLDAILDHHIDLALAPYAGDADAWMLAYLHSEKMRLRSLLKSWFGREARRQDFQVVATERQLEDISVGRLKLNLRIDRVDQLLDGGHLLLDYKTGQVSTSQWAVPRPEEPQLPLYAMHGGVQDIRGVLFARIRAGMVDMLGHVEDAVTLLDGKLGNTSALVKQPYTQSMADDWATALLQLADEFLRGEASVAPKRYPKTCEFCPLGSLCRIRESVAGDAVYEEWAGEADDDVAPGQQRRLRLEADND